MKTLILLDTGPLGLATHPQGGEDARRCKEWLESLPKADVLVRVPAIADYELRRELLRGKKTESVTRLDCLIAALGYIPLNRECLELAAEFWAEDRNSGRPNAPDYALDGDGLLAAQACLATSALSQEELDQGIEFIIATTNPKHLDRHAKARLWSEIQPDEPPATGTTP